MGGGDEPPLDRLAHEPLKGDLAAEIERRRAILRRGAGQAGVLAAAEARARVADEEHGVAVRHERGTDEPGDVVEQPDDPDLRRRQDRAPGRLVVERDVSARDGQAERQARVAEAADGLLELPERLGPGGVAEVQAVRHAERPRAGD